MMHIGFVGLGVMGGAMCRNMALKHEGEVYAFDVNKASVHAALDDTPGRVCSSVKELAERSDIVFLSLPGGDHVREVCLGETGLMAAEKLPSTIVDLSTTTVASARGLAGALAEYRVAFADAPVARTREAAQRGELSIMVGASASVFEFIRPMLDYIATDVTHCGAVGCGQAAKLINNALVFEHTAALAEMLVLGKRAGIEPALLIDVLSKGSGDSFVLRNHGRKAMLPGVFPEKAFPSEYVLKDLGYVLSLSEELGVDAPLTRLTQRYYMASAKQSPGKYFPVVIQVVEDKGLSSESDQSAAANEVPHVQS